MKTLLIRPFTDSTKGDSPPLSLMNLSSSLKKRSLEVDLFDNCVDRKRLGDFSINNKFVKRILDRISESGPDLVGMTLFSGEINDMFDLCQAIKRNSKSIAIVLGGPHATAMPGETLSQVADCDFVIRGEAENSLPDLITSLSNGGPLTEVRGLSFRMNGKNHHGQDAEIISNLDDVPFPDRDSLL
jgi:radical SAM superfamily enzyme YgiQ (UPF0313 family)